MPSIEILEGSLIEGNSLELIIDFSDDALSFSHSKKFTAFSERNIKYDQFKQEYYYEEGKGVVYQSTDADNLLIDKLVTGRLFVLFQYTNIYGETSTLSKVYQILPSINVIIDNDILTNKNSYFKIQSTAVNISAYWDFNDEIINGIDFERSFEPDGYRTVNIDLNYTNLKYQDQTDVIWNSVPSDKLVNINYGYFGGGTIGDNNLIDTKQETFLVKYDLTKSLTLDVYVSSNNDGNYIAPLRSLITDNSVYNLSFEGENRIEYVILDFGDGDIRKSTHINFEFYKLFKLSGTYNIKYTVYTIHEPIGGDPYRQNISFNTTITIKPFFEKFFKDQLSASFYNSEGFNDLASAWGLQMDRVYNETQKLLESIDVEYLDNKFLSGVAFTYGDFEEIYKKIGFVAFTKDRNDIFSYLKDYNFFDRLSQGDLLDSEKQEFIHYIRNCIENLRLKGTPISIEKAIANFGLIAKVNELWVTTFKTQQLIPLKDEVFNNDIKTNTGINYKVISSPSSYNNESVVINSNQNSYIQINTAYKTDSVLYTKDSEVTFINGKSFIAVEKS